MASSSELFPSERLEDFTKHQWCNALLSDPSIAQLHKREMPSDSVATRKVSNTYFAQTMFTDDAVRAMLYLYRPHHNGNSDIVPQNKTRLTEKHGNLTPDEKGYLQEAVEQASAETQVETDVPETMILVSLGKGIESGVNIVHGGVTAALLDQTMGRLIWYMYGTFPATAEITVKYRRPIPTPRVVLCRARIVKDEGRFVQTGAWVEDGKGKVLAEGSARFLKSVAGPPRAKL